MFGLFGVKQQMCGISQPGRVLYCNCGTIISYTAEVRGIRSSDPLVHKRRCLMGISSMENSVPSHLFWIYEPVAHLVNALDESRFFSWLEALNDVKEFRPVATQIFHHSLSLPRLISGMVSQLEDSQGRYFKILCQHAFEEADHHLLLANWMIKNHLADSCDEIYNAPLTLETSTYINYSREISHHCDPELWLATMNLSLELCYYKFFKVSALKMDSLGVGDEYFDIHVKADEEHFKTSLSYIDETDASSARGQLLKNQALNSVNLWDAMVHSWIRE